MLNTTLPAATVFHAVVAQLEGQVREVQMLAHGAKFKRSPMYSLWRTFEATAEKRIQMLADMKSGRTESKARDNMEVSSNLTPPSHANDWILKCGIIREQTAFRRCSSCQQVYYCSADCQRLDWRKGGHSEACHSIRAFSQSEYPLPYSIDL